MGLAGRHSGAQRVCQGAVKDALGITLDKSRDLIGDSRDRTHQSRVFLS